MKLPPKNGVESQFADDLDALSGFGKKNKETLGELLFQFFRFYGHDFDYDKWVISVRNGKHISKVEKGWHVTNNNRLCVEEPFNVGRNLGNTADDTSFRGLHMELRRAFDLVSKGKLEECCEQFSYPKEEERVWEKPPQRPKPILRSTSQSNRGGRGGTHRGGRHNNQHNRNGNSNRRASSGAFENNPSYIPGLPPNMSAQEIWLQRQAQAQLHNDLYATYSVLQAQENSLRLQLYAQGLQNQAYAQAQAQGQVQGNGGIVKQQATDRNRTNSFDQPPLSAPLRPDLYYYPLQYPATPMFGYQTPSTNPSSPSLSNAVPELRRSMHRSSVTNGSGPRGPSNSSLRSHSQPATRSAPSPLSLQGSGMMNPGLGIFQTQRQAHGIMIPNFIADENMEPNVESRTSAKTPPEDTTPREYVGYYVSDHAPSPMRRESVVPMAIPAFGDIAQTRRRLSTDQLPQSILDRLKRPSRSPSPLGHNRSFSSGVHSAPITAAPSHQGISNTNLRALNNQAPLVVNGSNTAPVSIPSWQASVSEGSSEDHSSDMLVGSMDSFSQEYSAGSVSSGDQDLSGQVTPRDPRAEGRMDPPMVVNGSTPLAQESAVKPTQAPVVNGTVPHPMNGPNGLVHAEQLNGPLRLSPNTRNRLARQVQNGGMSPLDIGSGQNEIMRDDLPHLSPVYETRTPSPTANRKFEPGLERKPSAFSSKTSEQTLDASNEGLKNGPTNGHQPKQQDPAASKSNGHTRASKSEGAGPNTWQKIPKGKKKGSSAEQKNNGTGQAQSEKPPSNENERKGG
jgi:hypothetical protein